MVRLRPHHLLALLPPTAILGGVPWANGIHRYVLGLPFLLFWILACVVATSAVMALVGALDRREEASAPPPADDDPDGPRP
jgi:hypothetical protein